MFFMRRFNPFYPVFNNMAISIIKKYFVIYEINFISIHANTIVSVYGSQLYHCIRIPAYQIVSR